mmetsp:Transcript_19030/g.40141  ORF Transcript_19030/g.40141 Transcript_19030/m.40141 type:complete len:467 (-) Transcript_19030:331-1731(-)
MAKRFSLLSSLPDEHLPHILSYLTLKDVLHMRLVCAHFRDIVFESSHHLWMDNRNTHSRREDGSANIDMWGNHIPLTSRRMRLLLSSFTKLRSLRLIGLRLVYHSLIEGINGTSASPRYICSLLQEAECAQNLERLELLNVSESQTESGEWGAAPPPSFSLHTDIRLKQLRKLTIEGDLAHTENPLAHSLLRASHQITHLNLIGCFRLHDYDVEEAIMKPLSNTLVHLNLSSSGIENPFINSLILKTLVLRSCPNLRGLDRRDSHPNCPSLDILDLSFSPNFDGEGLLDTEYGLATFCPRLSTLRLSGCSELEYIKIKLPIPLKETIPINNAEHSAAFASMESPNPMESSRLENVDLSQCISLSNATISGPLKNINLGECMGLKVLSIASPHLEMLDLSRLPLHLLSLRCDSLRNLNLAWCRDLESKHSKIKCEALESVDIRGATYITPGFFHDASGKCNLSVRSH